MLWRFGLENQGLYIFKKKNNLNNSKTIRTKMVKLKIVMTMIILMMIMIILLKYILPLEMKRILTPSLLYPYNYVDPWP